MRAEEVTNHGQVDMTVFVNERVYVFEFKVVEIVGRGSALEQIRKGRYYEKYLNDARRKSVREVYLVGVEFSRESRNIVNYEWERVV